MEWLGGDWMRSLGALLLVLLLAMGASDAQSGQQIVSASNSSTIATCCYIQDACKGCRSIYSVNSITYCCPSCHGDVMVTDLICTCYAPGYTNPATLNCTMSNAVVGGYPALRPSYYYTAAPPPARLFVSSGALTAAVILIRILTPHL